MHRFRLAVAAFGLLLLALFPAAVGASYPPNTVVSTYFDARFCGNGEVSVVADQNGKSLISARRPGSASIPPPTARRGTTTATRPDTAPGLSRLPTAPPGMPRSSGNTTMATRTARTVM